MKCIVEHKKGLNVKGVSRNHTIIMDLDSPSGGNEGMTPGEVFLNSVAGCKMITFISLAKINNIDVEDLTIEVSGEKESLGPMDKIKIPRNIFKSIYMVYKLKTKNTKEEIAEYLKIVDEYCTVGNALSKDIKKTSQVIIKP